MLIPLKLIAEIENCSDVKTAYFYNFATKTLLPITVKVIPDYPGASPNIYDTFHRTLNALHAKLIHIKIYLFRGNKFYTYLTFVSGGLQLDINCSLEDALVIMKISKCSVFAKDKLLHECGIKVTSELIKQAMS